MEYGTSERILAPFSFLREEKSVDLLGCKHIPEFFIPQEYVDILIGIVGAFFHVHDEGIKFLQQGADLRIGFPRFYRAMVGSYMLEEHFSVVLDLTEIFSFTEERLVEYGLGRYLRSGDSFGKTEYEVLGERQKHMIFREIGDPDNRTFVLPHSGGVVENSREIVSGGDEHIVELLRMESEFIDEKGSGDDLSHDIGPVSIIEPDNGREFLGNRPPRQLSSLGGCYHFFDGFDMCEILFDPWLHGRFESIEKRLHFRVSDCSEQVLQGGSEHLFVLKIGKKRRYPELVVSIRATESDFLPDFLQVFPGKHLTGVPIGFDSQYIPEHLSV